MGRIIEAKAVISAEDRTGKVFDQIARKFKEVGKGAKVSAEIDKMNRSLKGAQDTLKNIDKYRADRGAFYTARKQMQETRAAAAEAARALSQTAKPTREQEQNLRRLQRVADDAARSFERQKTAVLSSRSALTQGGVAVGGLIREHERLGKVIDRTSAAIKRQQALAKAEGNLTTGMGAAGRREHARIARDRYLIDGMGAAGRAARSERERKAAEDAEARAQRRAQRREAATVLASGAGIYASHKINEGTHATIETYRDFDKYARQTEAFGNFSKKEMSAIVDMAIHGGATSRYNDIQWLQGAKALGGRGVKAGSVMSILPEAAQYGQAMSTDLPEAVAGLEGSLFAFRRDLSTPEKARAAARRTADLQVSAAKAFGLTHHDLKGGYEYGALGADMTGLGEEKLLAFLGLGKKLNIDGITQGNAFRAMTSKFLSPTRKGREALAAVGVDYSKRQIMPDRLSVDNFASMAGQQYGVKLDGGARQKLEAAFSNKEVFTNATSFALAIKDALKGQVGINNAKDANKVIGSAERFRQVNVEKVDVNGLFDDVMRAIQGGNLALSNAIFGEKQGNRIMAALRDGDVWGESLKKIQDTPDGKAQGVAEKMNAGFDGAVSRFEGAIKNLETAMGRSWDRGGEGGFLTGLADVGGKAVQGLAEMNAGVLQVAGGLAWLGGKAIGAAGTIGLVGSALALTKSAADLSAAAVVLGGRGATGAAAASGAAAGASRGGAMLPLLAGAGLPLLGTAAVGAALVYGSDHSKALVHGGRPTGEMNPADVLPGLSGAEGASPPGRSKIADWWRSTMPTWAGGSPIPVEVKALPSGADASGQASALTNTLDKAASASATAANGGQPIEATVRPDQITARVTEAVPVSGEANVSIDNKLLVSVSLNEPMLQAKIDSAAGRAVAKIPLSSSGSRPGAVSMPGAAATPGAAK